MAALASWLETAPVIGSLGRNWEDKFPKWTGETLLARWQTRPILKTLVLEENGFAIANPLFQVGVAVGRVANGISPHLPTWERLGHDNGRSPSSQK